MNANPFMRLLTRFVLKHAKDYVASELRALEASQVKDRFFDLIYTTNSRHRLTITPDCITLKMNPAGMTDLEIFHMKEWAKYIARNLKPLHQEIRLSGSLLKGKFCLQDGDKTVTIWASRRDYEATLPPVSP